MKRAVMYVSSVTGNTRKISEELRKILSLYDWELEVCDTVRDGQRQEEADLLIICFWCRRSGMDARSLELLDTVKKRKIAAFGTMGSYADSEYGRLVRENVQECIDGSNHCLGVFLCRGKIAPERTRRRRQLSKDHPHYLDDAGYERHVTSRTHPDERDLKNAGDFLKDILENEFNEEKRDA